MMLLGASRVSLYDEPERAAAAPTAPPIEDEELAPLAEAALSASLPSSFPLAGVSFRSLSDGGVPSLGLGAATTESYDAMHLSLGGYRDDPFLPRSLAADARRRRTDPVYVRQPSAYPRSPVPPLPTLSLVPPPLSLASDHDRRKEIERMELIEMILESVASVPMALEKIHTNPRLRAALEQEMGGEHTLLHRLLAAASMEHGGGDRDGLGVRAGSGWTDMHEIPLVEHPELPEEALADEDDEADGGEENEGDEDEDDGDDSSDYDSDYENDLAEAVNQLVMTEGALSSEDLRISVPMPIHKRHSLDQSSNLASNSPQSSIFGASPGTYSQDGEPAAALWPRQPHQFVFTQEEEEEEVGAPVQDEVYSELAGATGEDEAFFEGEEEEGEEEEGNEDEDGDPEQAHLLSGVEKVFDMDDGDEDGHALDYHHAQRMLDNQSPSGSGGSANGFTSTTRGDLGLTSTGVGLDEEEGEEDGGEDEYEVFELRIFREKERTGFEANEDWRPRIGSLVGGRYRVQMEIGEAVFSRTYKGTDTVSDEAVCLKIIKNSKEYFDQGIDEIRVLQYIAAHCDVDEKHLVRLQDFFYFREHLIIVTELLRDNLYEFSKLLLERGNINYFSMPRLKKVAIEVLEALDVLHGLGLVHCDLKPENILISNFNECRIKVIDFGSACFVTDELTSYVQSRSYRAPEVILGLGYDQKIDLWSLGCVLAELFTGDVLFKNDSEQSLLERIIGAIGPIPRELLLENSELDVQFRENPAFAMDPATGNGVLSPLHASLPTLESLMQTDDAQFLDFLRALLQIHPNDRVSAAEALQHRWLQHGVFSRS